MCEIFVVRCYSNFLVQYQMLCLSISCTSEMWCGKTGCPPPRLKKKKISSKLTENECTLILHVGAHENNYDLLAGLERFR